MSEEEILMQTYPAYKHWEEDEQTLYERDPFELVDEYYDRINNN